MLPSVSRTGRAGRKRRGLGGRGLRARMISLAAAIEEMAVTLPTTLASRVAGLELFAASQGGSLLLTQIACPKETTVKGIVEACPLATALGASHASLESSIEQGEQLGSILPIGFVTQFGSPGSDSVRGIAANEDGVFVTGETDGDLYGTNAGSVDVFVARYNANGTMAWGVQLGSSYSDKVESIAVNGDGLFVIGHTLGGSIYGDSSGSWDVIVASYNLDGTEAWGSQFGTSSADYGHDIAVSGDGVFTIGSTGGNMYGSSAGLLDVIVARYNCRTARRSGAGSLAVLMLTLPMALPRAATASL